MRYALISDLHANIQALDAALERIDALGPDRIVCLGDIVGYHADPEACIERVRERGICSLAGNHDRAVIGARSAVHFGSRARRVVGWTKHRLSPDSRDFLASLPVARSIDGAFFAVHAALHPEPNDELHLSTKERVSASLKALSTMRFGSRLCFFGHTHRPVVHTLRGGRVDCRDIDVETTVEIDRDAFCLINPGSVGQSRDGDPRASFAIYDSDRATVSFHRVAYDMRACHDKAKRAGLFDPEPAHVRSSVWVSARMDSGARFLRRALERALG